MSHREEMEVDDVNVVWATGRQAFVRPVTLAIRTTVKGCGHMKPSWTVALQACATQEGCGQLIRVKPWALIYERDSFASLGWISCDTRRPLRYLPLKAVSARFAALDGKEETWARGTV